MEPARGSQANERAMAPHPRSTSLRQLRGAGPGVAGNRFPTMTVILEPAEGADMKLILAAVAVAAFLAGCGSAQGSAGGEQTTARSDSTLTCSEHTSMDLDYGSTEGGYTTPELAAKSIAKSGQIVKITSQSNHESSFTIETSNGDMHASGTLFKADGGWLIEHLATCDPIL
jgi:hypothetical protein